MIKDWKNILILPNESILNAIQALDKSGLRIVIVADKEQNLLGTVCDGDIRKAIMNKVSLDSPVSIIMNSSPFYFSSYVFLQQHFIENIIFFLYFLIKIKSKTISQF